MVELTARVALESMMAATDDDATPIIRRLARIQARTVLDRMKATPDAAASEAGEVERLRAAMHRIEQWELPETGRFWLNDDGTLSDRPMSYETAYGSNGARDYIRQIARDALSPTQGGAEG